MGQLIASVPLKDLVAYPKLARAYYSLLNVFFSDQFNSLYVLDPAIYLYILESIDTGLRSTGEFMEKDMKNNIFRSSCIN
jgi:hypothetical protein